MRSLEASAKPLGEKRSLKDVSTEQALSCLPCLSEPYWDALALSGDALPLSGDALALSGDALALSVDALALLVDALALSDLIRYKLMKCFT